MNLAIAINALFPGIDFENECILVDDGKGPYIAKWNRPEKQPTDAEIAAAEVLATAAQADVEAKRAESNLARDDVKRALSALDTIIGGIDAANLAQAKTAIKQLAVIAKQHILATVGR